MFTSLHSLFFPAVCAGCGQVLAQESLLCVHCLHHLPFTQHDRIAQNEVMTKCYGRIDVAFAGALLYFEKESAVRQMIHALKYRGKQSIGVQLGDWAAERYAPIMTQYAFDAVIPVPLHPKKLRERGYNQVQSFAETLAKHWSIDCDADVLVRNRYSKTQTRKNLLGRSDTVSQSLFGIADELKRTGCHLLLVDDVITTGSTLESCYRALKNIPNVKISVLAMAFSNT